MTDAPGADYRPVPVREAARISRTYGKSVVVIICVDGDFVHTTAYGASPEVDAEAKRLAERLTGAAGGDLSRKTVYE